MDWLIFAGVAVVLVAAGVFAQHKDWIDVTGKHATGSRSSGTLPLGAIDEVFQPTRYEAQLQYDAQTTLPAPAPTPDGDKDLYKGNVKIDVSKLPR